jgi:hypothetical protein
MTLVVVQSDDLTAWVGAVSGLAGVALGAALDSWRRRGAERKQARREMLQAALEVRSASFAVVRGKQLAGPAADTDPGWVAVIDARYAAMRAAIAKIETRGIKELSDAGAKIMNIALECQQTGRPAILSEHSLELQSAMDDFATVVRKAKL